MSTSKPVQIDVRGILKAKAPHAKIPGFIINYLRKIAHEEQLNRFLKETNGLKNVEFMEQIFNLVNVTIEVEGQENLPPKDGKYIFVSNHPLGGLDGVAIGYVLGKQYDGNIGILANDLLSSIEPLREVFLPVNKVGAQNKEYAKEMLEFYDSDKQLFTFPAGVCSRKNHGKIRDLQWQKNFVSKAVQHQRDVIPIYFEGKNSNFFYRLANLRKLLGIKFNVEMMYLSDELFKQYGNNFKITIGKPIPWQTFDKSKRPIEWAQWVKEIAYKIPEDK